VTSRSEALDARLRDHLRKALAEPRLEFAERPTRLTGGFDTQIFAFRLGGAPRVFAGPLILRLLDAHHEPTRALRERATQNALADLGYPAPRVLLASADDSLLGGAFLIMQRVAGQPLPKGGIGAMASVLADLHARLHDVDPVAFLRAVTHEGLEPRSFMFDAHLAQLADRASRGGLGGLEDGLEWLARRRPPRPEPRAVCHGDFHPYNILMADGGVTGVLDWPHAIVADPAFDVATTLVILKLVPMKVAALPARLRWLANAARPLLVGGYLRRYRRRRPLDREKLAYYEAAACMKALVRAGELRGGPGGETAANVLFESAFTRRVLRRFRALTSITPTLPPAATPVA
jgi:aminoglycoside phosphotransferase (APT) family kinase protein